MLLFPYKADVELGRWPVLTLVVCAICLLVFAQQAYSDFRYREALETFCTTQVTRDEQLVLRYLSDDPNQHYCNVMLAIREAPATNRAMLEFAEQARPIPFYPNRADSTEYIYGVLSDSWYRFQRAVPKNLTDELHYDPSTMNVGRMITAAFSHADVFHLISNLIFFFAFAASVEVITGYFYFSGFILLTAIGTHVAYAYSVRDVEGALPTVGLSGVVMATMAFLATVLPTLRIRCFLWFLFIVRTFRVPALAIALLYIVQNVVDFAYRGPTDNVNYVAHISGAAMGAIMGWLYRIRHRQYLQDLVAAT